MTNPAHLSVPIAIGTGFAKTHANPDTPRYRSGQAHGT